MSDAALARTYETYRIACGLRADGVPRPATMQRFWEVWEGPAPVGAGPRGQADPLTNALRNGRTTGPRSACGSDTTISAGFTVRSATRAQWKRELLIAFGTC